jgi:hypothetical protein
LYLFPCRNEEGGSKADNKYTLEKQMMTEPTFEQMMMETIRVSAKNQLGKLLPYHLATPAKVVLF